MKIKFLLLVAAFFASSQAFSKEKILKNSDSEIESLTSINLKPKDTREGIEPFDFQKLFQSAEGYFKAAKAWEKLKCEPKSGFICTKHECKKRDIKATLLLDKNAKTITRCEKDICETYSAEFEQTGVFYNIQSKGPIGTLIRVLGDSRYKEISTVGLDAYIANGNCEVFVEKSEEKKSK